MNIIETGIPDLVLLEPKVFPDKRGYFFEAYQRERFRDLGITDIFVQDNESMSAKNVLRGLHFQTPPYAQAKLVRVVKGVVQDVAVDIRTGSPTYGKWFSAILSEENKNMMFIPAGFAHGFLTLENNTIFQYKCSQIYHKESEGTIAWNDPTINIKWQSNTPSISAKDQHGQALKNFKNPFSYPEK